MNMIISLRGTSGSGKSYLVKELLRRFSAVPESTDPKGRPLNYVMSLDDGSRLYVIGRYTNACGGCDGIQPYSEIWPRVVRLQESGHVLFEGLLLSSSYGTVGKASEAYGDRKVFAFMDTPLDKCLARVAARRAARGHDRPLNPKNTVNKHACVQRSIEVIRGLGRRVEIIDHERSVERILEILYEGGKGGELWV